MNLPSLVQINKKHDIISETSDSVGSWHGNNKRENVIDESVESLVNEQKLEGVL